MPAERYLLIQGPFPLGQQWPYYLAQLGEDGIVRVVRGVDGEGSKDLAKLLEWMQPDQDGIKSGQLCQTKPQPKPAPPQPQPQPQKPSALWQSGTRTPGQ
jgi:hypothetical protein